MMNLAEDDDWEYLPDAATYRRLLLLHDSDSDDNRDRDPDSSAIPLRSSPSLFDMDYFSTSTSDASHLIPLQFPPSPTLIANDVVNRLLQHHDPDEEEQDVEITSSNNNNNNSQDAAAAALNNKVFFKSSFAAKESIESVDMKFLDSSSSPTATSPRKTKSVFEFDDLFSEDQISRSLTLTKSDEVRKKITDDVNWIGEGIIGDDYVVNDDEDNGGIVSGLNLWKLGFGGIGAVCSFGVAAATLCLILFGNSHKAKQNHKLRFQIYSDDDQRMKKVVQQASKFNEAMSAAVRGVPLNMAHITYGGYYDNAL